jgi:hypothetical protein
MSALAERTYNDSAALEARSARQAAEACNDLFGQQEAFVLACIMDTFPAPVAVEMLESAFEANGWPADDLDACFLKGPGKVAWKAFQFYRGEGRVG